MTRNVSQRELLVGVEGLALLRGLYDGTDEAAERRLAEVREILDDEALTAGKPTPEAGTREGYRSWASTYDEPGNPIVAIEGPVVGALIDGAAPGRALDAACGTGRHAKRLAERGHDVLGVDASPEMLARAAESVPGARFAEGDLRDLPAADESFDLAVCALALSHLEDVGSGVGELARVVRPGGRVVISVLHPFQALLGWQAPFTDPDGRRAFVREHPHTHADYLAAFRVAGLAVRDCVEPLLGAEEASAKRRAHQRMPEATVAAYAGLPGLLVWDLERS